MRSIFTLALQFVPLLAFPAARVENNMLDQPPKAGSIDVLEHNPDTDYTKFSVPCPGCFFTGLLDDDESSDFSLVFELDFQAPTNTYSTDFRLNGQILSTDWQALWDNAWTTELSPQVISVPDTSGSLHTVLLAFTGSTDTPPSHFQTSKDAVQSYFFRAVNVDSQATSFKEFIIVVQGGGLRRIMSARGPPVHEFNDDGWISRTYDSNDSDSFDAFDEMLPGQSDDDFDLTTELEELSLLEKQAGELRTQIKDRKEALSKQLRQHEQKLCLKHLLKECDGVFCAAKAVAMRVCDKVGIKYNRQYSYAQMKEHFKHQNLFNEKTSIDDAGVGMPGKNYSVAAYKTFDLVDPPNPLIKVLSVLAAVLGLSALYAFIKRKCVSARTRAERAADREERRNARAYRRAARRALMRKRWDNFVQSINCFRVRVEPRVEDYEEKRALILQDAFLEQELDQAEKGEVMEAEIRELRNAHEIVSGLVGIDEYRRDLITPVNDPPPPLVPLPYTPGNRSRASTFTLPSYTSESLPDYTSRPSMDRLRRTSSGFTQLPSSEDGDSESGRSTPGPSRSESSGHTGYTPTSSVLETSPRPSQETLRTRLSRDTQ